MRKIFQTSILTTFTAIILSACGQNSTEIITVDALGFNDLQDVKDAPPIIQDVAKAIVKIESSDSSGTGFFINANGLLMTNNHVLGSENCAREGCYIGLYFDFQKGVEGASIKKQEVFAKPIYNNATIDVSISQIYNLNRENKPILYAPYNEVRFLEFTSKTSTELIDNSLTIVGHPKGGLKKFVTGEAIRAEGKWVHLNSYILPGSSGSPILNAEGKVVGIVHRSSDAQGDITRSGIKAISIGSSSAEIQKAFKDNSFANPPIDNVAALISINDKFENNSIYKYSELLRNYHTNIVNKTSNVKDLIARQCDKSLDYLEKHMNQLEQAEVFNEELTKCEEIASWLNCSTDEKPAYKFCPTGDVKRDWEKRFEKINTLWQTYYGKTNYNLSLLPLELESDDKLLNKQYYAITRKFLDNNQPLNLNLARISMQISNYEYQGRNLIDYLINYKKEKNHQYYYSDILSGLNIVYKLGFYSKEEMLASLKEILSSPNISIAEKLRIEVSLYKSGLYDNKSGTTALTKFEYTSNYLR